jgi:probable phosphoglycerate mutase
MAAPLRQLQPSGQHTGNTDIPLTPAGEATAPRLQPLLGGLAFAQLISSPLQWARRTADLAEWNYWAYAGLTSAQI